MFASIQDGISVLNPDLTIRHVNGVMKQWYEQNLPLEGKKCYECYHNRHKPCDPCPTLQSLKSGKTELEIVPGLEGSPVEWIELFSYPMKDPDSGEVTGVLEVVRDITERKRTEKRRQIEYRIASAVSTAKSLNELYRVIQKELEMVLDTANFFVALYNKENDTISLPYIMDEKDHFETFPAGRTMTAYVIHNDKPILAQWDEIEKLIQSGEVETIGTPCEVWLGVPLKAGEEVIGAMVVQSYTDKNAFREQDLDILKFVSNQIGLSIERKQSEEALRESEERFRSVAQTASDAIISSDSKGNIISWNQGAETIFGYTVDEAISKSLTLIIPERYRAVHQDAMKKIDSDEPAELKGKLSELIGLRKDGTEFPLELSMGSWKTKDGIFFTGIMRDITEREQLKITLLQTEKMSALGQLISGVAHELNNPLTGVLGFSQLLLMSPDLPEKDKNSIEMINKEAERARRIVRNLLSFARQTKPEKRIVQINEIIDRTLDLRAYEMRVSNIEVVRMLDPDTPTVLADEHQLQQVFMNILINAEQAMLSAHGRGRLEVKTYYETKGGKVEISFQDDGPGISRDHLAKIFDPFFTTKPVGKGTGLGLSIAYGIVQEHEGTIVAVSEGESGTLFKMVLPCSSIDSTEGIISSSQSELTTEVQGKKILVVDDETSIVDLIRVILEREGYTVETAYDGNVALRKIEEEDFDGIISDLKMPGKDGVEIYQYCKEKKPDLTKRFLFLTGDMVAHDSMVFVEENKVPFISKPFDLDKFLSFISTLF